jgi:hypothetical protein
MASCTTSRTTQSASSPLSWRPLKTRPWILKTDAAVLSLLGSVAVAAQLADLDVAHP